MVGERRVPWEEKVESKGDGGSKRSRSDEDEGVDGSFYEGSDGPRRISEPFNPQLATYYWPRLDGDGTSA